MNRKNLLILFALIGLIIPIRVFAAEWDPYGVNMVSKYDNNKVDDRNFKDFIFEVSTFSPENESVFMVAPGENIPCIGENGEVVNASGLSMAVAHVAGALADLLEKRNTYKTELVFEALVAGSNKIKNQSYTQKGEYGLRNDGYGYGLLNISKSLDKLPCEHGFNTIVGN